MTMGGGNRWKCFEGREREMLVCLRARSLVCMDSKSASRYISEMSEEERKGKEKGREDSC